MTIREWERQYEEIHGPLGLPDGYGRWDVPSRKELRRRDEIMNALLEDDTTVGEVRLQHRKEDFYDAVGYVRNVGEGVVSGFIDIAYDVGEMLDPRDREK